MKTKDFFQVGKNNIAYVWSDFQEWFNDVNFKKYAGKVVTRDLETGVNDEAVLKELKPAEVTLGFVAKALTHGAMLKNGCANIFYVKDINEVVRAVGVRRLAGGWGVFASPVDSPFGWLADARVFSRKFGPLTPSNSLDFLPLELIINGIKYKRE